MCNFTFTIPLQLKDLVNNTGRGEYRVEEEFSVRDLKLKLNVSPTQMVFLSNSSPQIANTRSSSESIVWLTSKLIFRSATCSVLIFSMILFWLYFNFNFS